MNSVHATDTAPAAPAPLEQATPGYTLGHRLLELVGVVLAYGMVAYLCWRFVDVVRDCFLVGEAQLGQVLGATVAAALLVGYVLADFMSGLIHWGFDRFGTNQTFLLGPNFVRPFREHHVDPKAITRHDFLETNGNNCIVTVPALALLIFGPFDLRSTGHLFFVATITFGAIFTFATNQFHKWAHEDKPPRIVDWMQRKHIILPVDHHAIHHTFPYETHYCITTGWMNALLSKIGFWAAGERLAERLLKMKVHRDAAPVERPQ